MEFRLIDHTDLDKDKWDRLIANAENPRIYALSWYLDTVCSNGWKAVIDDSYSVGLPLPLNTKIPFFPRIAVPPFSQQLGVFYTKKPESFKRIFDVISVTFREVILQCNEHNGIIEVPGFEVQAKPNFTLALNDLKEVRKAYAKRLKANLKNAAKHELVIVDGDAESFISQYLSLTDKQIKVTPSFEAKFRALIQQLTINKLAIIKNVFHNGELLSTCLLTLFHNRLTYLMARSTAEGKAKNSMHFLLDHLITEHCGKGVVLDFEGSSISGLAHFFKSFGAQKNEYSLMTRRRFPF